MSEQPDRDSKTEQPTEKRLADAREKGNTPFSREIVSLGSLVAVLAAFQMVLPDAAQTLTAHLRHDLSIFMDISVQSQGEASTLLRSVMQTVAGSTLPFLVLLALGGIVGSLVQNMPSANTERVTPKWERLSPGRNLRRIAGKEALIEFAKTSAKFMVLAIIVSVVLNHKISDLVNVGAADPTLIPATLIQTAVAILVPTCVFILALAIVDVIWTRLKWWEDLKMTRQEVRDEHKLSEGDPLFKQRRRAIALKRLKGRMLADVPKATLVVVNPTHFAVAMRYVPEEGGAPLVLAKGLDLVALKIREISDAHRIPIVENKPLARSLYAACDVGDMIPAEHYRAVAEIIHFVERKRQLSKRSLR